MSNKLTFFNSILLTLSTIFTLSAIVTNFVACSNETGKTPGIEEKPGLAGKTISFKTSEDIIASIIAKLNSLNVSIFDMSSTLKGIKELVK